MSRTFRNKTTVPVGWAVRDDGCPYYNGTDKWGDALRKMNRHFRIPKYRRSHYRCETTGARRSYYQHYRSQTNHLVRVGRWDDILPPTRTSGWESW